MRYLRDANRMVWAVNAILALGVLAALVGCGRNEPVEDPALWHGGPENVSCVEGGGTFVFLPGNQFCQASGYVCLAPGEKAPCNFEPAE